MPSLARRHAILRTLGAAACVALPALGPARLCARPGNAGGTPAARPLRPTPAQTEGPFYPLEFPADSDADLLRNGALRYDSTRSAQVSGRVVDTAGRPLQGAVVEIWQCDDHGRYHHPGDGGRADPAFQGFGRCSVQADGSYAFRTLKPTAYTGRAPHIHVKVRLQSHAVLTTQLYVAGDPGNPRDALWRALHDEAERAALAARFEPGGDAAAWKAWFPIVIPA